MSAEEKSMPIALILSFFVWGLGQLYQGRTKVGIIWIVLWLISVGITLVTLGFFGIIALVLWLINLYDTYAMLIELD
ncbi:MAG: hypothetical protein ACOCR0_03555 [Haloferacaceae archaeon]